jgi:CRISPR-associated endonuclease/helicase Cas3
MSNHLIGHTYTESGRLVLSKCEPLIDHLKLAEKFCHKFMRTIGLGTVGTLCAYWHDLGKASNRFLKRINLLPSDEIIHYNHMMAGAIKALEMFGDTRVGRIIAAAVAFHHGCMRNWNEPPSQFRTLKRDIVDRTFKTEMEKYLDDCDNNPDDFTLFTEVNQMLEKLDIESYQIDTDHFGINAKNTDYYKTHINMLCRYALSSLIDADRLATELFYSKERASQRGTHATMRGLYKKLTKFCKKNFKNNTEINKWRTKIRECAKKAASREKGVFTLQADVGSGKTMAYLTFALLHAISRGMDRVFIVLPFDAILDQLYNIMCSIFGANNVCLHYMNMDTRKLPPAMLMATENWDAPFVITTVEQVHDTMYSNNGNRLRKLHNMANSVVVFDEAHAVPLDKMRTFIKVVNELANSMLFDGTVVLGSATLPVLSTIRVASTDDDKKNPNGILNRHTKEIIPPDLQYSPVRRLHYKFDKSIGSYDDLAKRVSSVEQTMVILNLKQSCLELATLLETREVADVYYLNTDLIPKDRDRILKEVADRLNKNLPVRLICTSIVQTGVDIDFPSVFREWCGLESLGQAGGRCNRNALRDECECVVFRTKDYRGRMVPGLPTLQAEAANKVLKEVSDVFDITAELLEKYWEAYVAAYKKRILDPSMWFDKNGCCAIENTDSMAFETVAERSPLIDDGQQTLIVPLDDESRQLTDKLIKLNEIDEVTWDGMNIEERNTASFTREDNRRIGLYITQPYGALDGRMTFCQWLADNGYAKVVSPTREKSPSDGFQSNWYVLLDGYDPIYGISRLIALFHK